MRLYPVKKSGKQRYTLSYFPGKSRCSVAGMRTKTYYGDEYEEAVKMMHDLQDMIDKGIAFEEICKKGKFTV